MSGIKNFHIKKHKILVYGSKREVHFSEIAASLKKSKQGIHQVLACGKSFKRKSRSGMPRVTGSRDDMHIRILASTKKISLSRIKNIIDGQIYKKTMHRRILESGVYEKLQGVSITWLDTTSQRSLISVDQTEHAFGDV
ncbi:hypothetical protein AVEN_109861-1 [Araneus ventricosus]|uniref:Uncharacterized protein n=1 Tax=Araneus ventricosus TaxID=182803 RepID=A0A4Y2PH40_ARAVE|nr:hypothetical protein AVEN_109861-1 [Araneus ventricosus]